MKILVISDLYPPYVIGGYELNCKNVTTGLIARGHELCVATSPSHFMAPPDPAYIRRCLNLAAFDPFSIGRFGVDELEAHHANCSNYDNISALIYVLRSFAPEVVFLWNTYGIGGLHIVDLLNRYEIPWVMYLGDRGIEQMLNGSPMHVRQVFNARNGNHFASGAIMAVSQHLMDEIAGMTGCYFARPVEIVHGYVVTYGATPPREYRPNGNTRFVTAAQVSEHKGTNIILEATAMIVAKGLTRFKVDIYGAGDVVRFANTAASLGLSEYVQFCGALSQQDLHARFPLYDIFLFPTWEREPFAFAPFEALAYGCVPVLTATCGCSERLVSGVHCLKVERSSEELARVMEDAVEGRLDLASLGAAGEALVRDDMSFESNLDKIESVLLAERRNWDHEQLNSERAHLLEYVNIIYHVR
jgi:glycogen(starch) synthase